MGNICRSPTAEGVVRTRLERALREVGSGLVIELDSAGTHGYHAGQMPDRRAVDAARRRGIDLSAIRSRMLSEEDFEAYDLILAMDRDNLAHLEDLCPADLQHRLGLFMAFARAADTDEVPDPYYGGLKGFDQVLDLVEEAADGLIDEIIRRQRAGFP
jgi:protein-tyrosine phosphatase